MFRWLIGIGAALLAILALAFAVFWWSSCDPEIDRETDSRRFLDGLG
jgi:hypothetical protein